MTEKDNVYLVSINDPAQVRTFSIGEKTPYKIAVYFLGRILSDHLLCRPGYRSIFLKSPLHNDMMEEIKQWLNSKK